jgi:hypothetical protein
MKKLLMAALLVLSLNANAEVIASMNNQGGGKIVLTSTTCPSSNLYVAYSYTQSGHTIMGCWTTSGDRVMVDWSGDIRSYPANAFVVTPKGKSY